MPSSIYLAEFEEDYTEIILENDIIALKILV